MLRYSDAALEPLRTWVQHFLRRLHIDGQAGVVFKLDRKRVRALHRQRVHEKSKRTFGGNVVGRAHVSIDVFGRVKIGIENIGKNPAGDDLNILGIQDWFEGANGRSLDDVGYGSVVIPWLLFVSDERRP